ncbi:MAG: adenylate/guanylate cyclase domain-containing protein, partial [bacterium]
MARLKDSLQAKILILVLILLGMGFGIIAVITIESERLILMEQMTERAKVLAGTLHKSIRSNMLEGRPDIARGLIKELKRQEGVKALQVFREDGSEAFSDLQTLIKVQKQGLLDAKVATNIRREAKRQGKMESLKDNPHFKKAASTGKNFQWMEELSDNGGKKVRVLTFLKPLENEPQCQACHGEESKVQGIIRVSTDVSELEARTSALQNRQITIAIFTLIVVACALVFFLRRTVIRPIEVLAESAARVGQGDFGACPPGTGNDEIGRLCQTFHEMAGTLSSAYEDLQSKNTELEKTLEELKESKKKVELLEALKGQMAKFVPESVKRLLEENPEANTLEKKDKDVTVLFLDIEGYTRMGENFPQEVVNNVIERYFSAFLDIVTEFKGDINETAGDGLMVIFHDDEEPMAHAANAVEAAIRIRSRTAEFNSQKAAGYPEVLANIGINTGVASVGATKFETPGGQARWTFTASGPVTNLASRTGSAATMGRIFIGPETARRVGDRYALVDMGKHSMKNIPEPMQVYQVIPTATIYP